MFMIKLVNIMLYKDNKLEQKYLKIKTLFNNDSYIFHIDDIKTSINKNFFKRENNEFLFKLNIESKEASYFLKENNINLDIDVEKVLYIEENNTIILEYKISSDDSVFKIVIESDNKI